VKKVLGLVFAILMILSAVFVGDSISSNGSLSVSAQTVTVSRRHNGVASRTYRGGRYVVRKTWNGTKYVSRRVWVASKYGAHKTMEGTRWTAHKTKRGTKKVFHKTKEAVQ
jgi:hypothetical protein